jgi:hypothetical protein
MENHKLVVEWAIPGELKDSFDVKTLIDIIHLTALPRIQYRKAQDSEYNTGLPKQLHGSVQSVPARFCLHLNETHTQFKIIQEISAGS